MRQVMEPSERICERVNAGDRSVRECQACEMRAEQHRRARFEVLRLLDCSEQIRAEQS